MHLVLCIVQSIKGRRPKGRIPRRLGKPPPDGRGVGDDPSLFDYSGCSDVSRVAASVAAHVVVFVPFPVAARVAGYVAGRVATPVVSPGDRRCRGPVRSQVVCLCVTNASVRYGMSIGSGRSAKCVRRRAKKTSCSARAPRHPTRHARSTAAPGRRPGATPERSRAARRDRRTSGRPARPRPRRTTAGAEVDRAMQIPDHLGAVRGPGPVVTVGAGSEAPAGKLTHVHGTAWAGDSQTGSQRISGAPGGVADRTFASSAGWSRGGGAAGVAPPSRRATGGARRGSTRGR